MSNKTYSLSEEQRAVIHSLLYKELEKQQKFAPWLSHLTDMFANEHPRDPEIVGALAVRRFLSSQGFAARQITALDCFNWGPQETTLANILEGLNSDDVVIRLLGVPSVGLITVQRCLRQAVKLGWIRNAGARSAVNKFLGIK